MEKRIKNELIKANAVAQALENTGVCIFIYYPQIKTITVPEKACELYHCRQIYENMPQSFADEYVYKADHSVFNEMYYKIDRGEKTSSAIFHSKDLNFCNHVTLTTVSWSKDGKPDEAIGIIENISDVYKSEKAVAYLKEALAAQNMNDEIDEAKKTVAASIGSQYFAVYHIWLERHTYICFHEQLPGILSVIGETGAYEPAWESYITGYIEENDQEAVRKFIDITTLADRIGRKNTITIIYRRKEIGWTRGTFIVGKRDKNGKPLTLIYTVSDINEEVENKLQREEAEQEALRDHLTKLWNRKAFEQFKEDERYKYNKAGIMLFDIDRFKGINDQFGHDAGDKVIITVANEMRDILRQNDLVFRVGGDEFAVLLHNCNSSVWNTMCRKIETLHANIKDLLPSEMNVTISAGICVNEEGYRDEMYKLADLALYNTKINGRGGCSFADNEGKIINEWHDKSSYLRKGDVLEKNSTVTWRMEIPKNKELPARIYGDDLYMDFLGLKKNMTPEENFKESTALLEPEYKEVLAEAAKATINEGQAEAIYLWNHPKKGKVQLRCSSSLDFETKEYYSLVGYIHIMKDMHVFTLEDVNLKIQKALEELIFCNFYIRLSDYSFKIYKAQPYMKELLERCKSATDAAASYIKYMVADESKEDMTEFLDMTTINQRMKNTNVLTKNYNDPNIGWSKATFTVVERDKAGEVETVILIVETMS